MKRPITISLAAVAIAVATAAGLVMTSPAASAATWSLAGSFLIYDATSGQPELACSASTISMTPADTPGTFVGNVTSLTLTCANPGTGLVTLTPGSLGWPVNASVGNRTIGETTGGHGISLALSSTGCTADIDGTGASTSTGVADFAYTHASGKLGVTITSGNLHIYNPAGVCTSSVHNGDQVSFSATYVIG
jgi:hypothetical protein